MGAGTKAVVGVLLLSHLAGCKIKGASDEDLDLGLDEIDADELDEQVQEAVDDARDIEICPGQTLEELFEADALSEECRDALLSFLPEPETSFEERIVAPGGLREVDGELQVLLQAADSEGAALSGEAFASLEVHVKVGGEERQLSSDEFSLTLAGELPDALIALSVVNDYSASMLARDLRDVADVEQDLFECLPPVYEAEVLRFSEEVESQLAFTADAEALGDAVAFDETFDRGTTALFDGLGASAADLTGNARPVRIVLLSTDGGENASMDYTLDEIEQALDDEGIFVVAMGALLADVDFMRDITAGRGVFFYTREFSGLQDAAAPYLESLKELVELHIAQLDPPPTDVRLVLDDLELTLP